MSVKCPISIEIKNNKHKLVVSKYGAVAVQKTADIHVDIDTMTSVIQVRSDSDIQVRLGGITNDIIPSYVFSNSSNMEKNGSVVNEGDVNNFLKDFGVSFNGIKAMSSIFDNKRKLISTVLPEGIQSILEIKEDDTSFENMAGDFFRLTSKDVADLKIKARFHAEDGLTEEELVKAEDDFISATIVSSLYRGFNVLLPGTLIPKRIVLDAKKKFKAIRKAGSNPVFYASQFQKNDPDIIGFSNAKSFLAYAAKSLNVSDLAIEGKVYVSLINSALTKREKLFIERAKKVGYKSRLYVANSIIDVFKKFIPGLSTEFLTQAEIEERFGSYFVNKKGFIIEGKLYFNIDKFTIDTVFHEFGHYYMSWLKNTDNLTYVGILDKIRETHGQDLAAYKKIYKNLDLLYTEDILLEEIFVDKIGLKALSGLIKSLPSDSKNAKAFTTKTKFDFSTKRVSLKDISGLPVYSRYGINSLRVKGTIEHFGNFFTGSLDSKKESFVIDGEKVQAEWPIKVGPYKNKSKAQLDNPKNKLQKLANIREAVSLYEAFIVGEVGIKELTDSFNLTPNQIKILKAQKSWIINQLVENTFDSLDVLYYTSSLKYTSHADVLSTLLTKYSTIEESFLDYNFTPDIEEKDKAIFSKNKSVTASDKGDNLIGSVIDYKGESFVVTAINTNGTIQILSTTLVGPQSKKSVALRNITLSENNTTTKVVHKGADYLVTEDFKIISLTTARVLKWGNDNADRKAIIRSYEEINGNVRPETKEYKSKEDVRDAYRKLTAVEESEADIVYAIYKNTADAFLTMSYRDGRGINILPGKQRIETDGSVEDTALNLIEDLGYVLEGSKQEIVVSEIIDGKKVVFIEVSARNSSASTETNKDIRYSSVFNIPHYTASLDNFYAAVDMILKGNNVFTYKGTSIDSPHKLGFEQEEAIKGAIDYILSDGITGSFNTLTIQGSAGTGKTTIIGLVNRWFKKSGGKSNFIYATPTHAANATLALANAVHGIRSYPSTVKTFIRGAYPTKKLKAIIKGGSGAVLIVDEASMLDPQEIEVLRRASSRIKIIFTGDPIQLPTISSTKEIIDGKETRVKHLSSVFNPEETLVLNKVYRQDKNTLLKVLGYIKSNVEAELVHIEDGDGTYQAVTDAQFESAYLTDFKKDQEDTAILTYTNKSVKEYNTAVKASLSDKTTILPGDSVIGYIGAGVKNPGNTSGALNSIGYNVESIDVVGADNASIVTSADIKLFSSRLHELTELGYENIQFSTITRYIPLSNSDSIEVEGVTEADLAKNRKMFYAEQEGTIKNILDILLSKDPDWKKAERIYNIKKNAFNSFDLGGDYIFNPETSRVEVFSYSVLASIAKNMGVKYSLLEDSLLIKTGINYGYSMTIHKSQGMGIKNNYVDPAFLNYSFLTDIIGLDGKVFNTEANSALYTAISRGSGKTIVRGSAAPNKAVSLNEAGLQSVSDTEKKLTVDITDSIETFVTSFVENLIGISGINPETYGISLDSKISKILDVAINDGGEDSEFLASITKEGLDSIKDFVTPKHTLFDVFNALKQKGRIRTSPDGRMILLDGDGNFVDENNNIIEGPTKFKVGEKDVDLKISNYLMRNRNIATALFSVNVTPTTLEGVALGATEKIVLDDSGDFYMNDGVRSERATQFLSDTFKEEFQIDRAVRYIVYNDSVNDYKFRNRSKGYTEEEMTAKAYEHAYDFVERGDDLYINNIAEVNTLFEFKTEEGTYLHAVAELFTRALNYSMKLPYPTAPTKRGPMYFMGQISEGISKINRADFVTYFDKNFFSFIENTGSHEYKAFVESYEFIRDNMDPESAAKAGIFLSQLTKKFKKDIFENIPGPLILIPELKLGSKALGLAGTIDLVVLDKNGYAHVFDYKNKKAGKAGWDSWEFSGGNNLKGEMKQYKDNAFMAASMQTSLYKIFFAELGIPVAESFIFYVENEITSASIAISVEDPKILLENERKELYSEGKMRYKTTDITTVPLVDVSSNLYEYAKNKGITLGSMQELNQDSLGILQAVKIAAGGVDIDVVGDVDAKAQSLYDEADAARKGFESKKKDQRQDMFDLSRLTGGTKSKGAQRGLRIYLDGNTSIDISSSLSEEAAVKEIKQLLLDRKDIAALEVEFEKTFLSLDRNTRFAKHLMRSKDKDAIFKRLLSGMDAETAEFTKFSSDINYGNAFGGIVMVKNKNTKETRVIILNHDHSRSLNFGENRSTVFGNYETNTTALIKFPKNSLFSNTHDMRVFKAGLVLALQKQKNNSFIVSAVVRNTSLASDAREEFIDLETTLKSTHHMLSLMIKNGESLPIEIQKLYDNKQLFDAKKYQPNPIDALREYLDILIVGGSTANILFNTKGGKADLANLKEVVDTFDPLMDYASINESLHKIKLQLERSLPTEEAKINNDMWNLIGDVTVFLASMNRSINPENTNFIGNFMFTPSKAANFFQAFFNQKITESKIAIRQDFISYKTEFNSEIARLAAAKDINISRVGPALFKSSMKEVFDNLYVDPTHTDREKAYTLKKLTDKSLKPEDKRFLKYYYNTMRSFTERSIFNKKEIREGWVALIRRSDSAFMTRMDEEDTMFEDLGKRARKLFSVSPKGKIDEAIDNDKEFSIHNRFESQIPHENSKESLHGTYERRRILGIDEYGNTDKNAINLELIEDNLESIMDTYVIASLDAIYYRDATALGRSMYYIIKKREAETGESLDDLIKTMVLTQRRVILGESSQQAEVLINGVNKFATFAVIGGAIPQAILEAVTNPAITTTNYLSDLLYGTLFRGEHRKFSAKSYAKATQIVWADYGKNKELVKAIDRLYGFSNSDTRDLKRLMSSLNKFGLFKTDNLMYVNHLMLTNWQQITMVAFMIEDGSFYAHSLDSKGNLVYNQEDDTRFDIRGKSAEGKLEAKKRLQATKEQLAKEPLGLTEGKTFEEKKMARAYTHFDVNRLKHLIVELYAGIDEAAKSLASYFTFMALITKMRFWLFPKMSRYFNKPMSAEENIGTSRLLRIEDETQEGGYRFEWKGEETEGILYSLKGIAFEAVATRGVPTLTEIQRVNMGKGLSDLFVRTVLWLAAIGFFVRDDDDDEFTVEMKDLMQKRLIMAGDDVFLLMSVYEIATGNQGAMFIGPSITKRAVSSMVETIGLSMQYVAGGDASGDDVLQSFNESMKKSLAIYKTVDTIRRGITRK